MLLAIAEIARQAGAWLLCDEVYRGTDQVGSGMTASVADLYEKGISTAGMSKAFSLAGLRLGWVAAPREVIEVVMHHRDYNTISVGMIDDHFAALALEHRDKILARSQAITRGNLKILADWVDGEPLISWVPPQSGTTALLKYDLDMPSREFCIELLQQTGVMFTPGSVMEMEGYVRIGYANSEEVLRAVWPRCPTSFGARHEPGEPRLHRHDRRRGNPWSDAASRARRSPSAHCIAMPDALRGGMCQPVSSAW